MTGEYDEIRPYLDEELPQIYEELIQDEAFRKIISGILPVPFEWVAERMRGCRTKLEFQKAFCYTFLKKIQMDTTKDVTLDLSLVKDMSQAHTYVSNHRDIVLDSGFLSMLLVDNGMDTVEIAIGDNLLIYPWIKKLVRVNKSFIVQRGLTMRQMLESSMRMSRYMHYTIHEKNQSIWIAQREGRAKDSNDRTQDSVLKMLAMGGEGSILDRIREMNILPLSISYEYDPCDYLKAKEFQLKRDVQDYTKTTQDDLKNMETGIFGYKGQVNFKASPCINEQLDGLDPDLSKQELYHKVSAIINKGIHSNYSFFPGNYVAFDLLEKEDRYTSRYTAEEKSRFKDYLHGQLSRIDLGHKDEDFLLHKLLEMYANPLKNYLLATQQ